MSLAETVAVVTGGGRGIGQAITERLAADGASVALLDIDDTRGGEVVQRLNARGASTRFFHCDIALEQDVAAAMDSAQNEFGGLDILVNNAGMNAYFDPVQMSEEEWDAFFATDLKGAWFCVKHAVPAMTRAGRGSIVNIASIHAEMTVAGMFPYAAAKSGLVGLTRSLALDYAPLNIRVNAVCPGYVRTQLLDEWLAAQPDPAAAERRMLDVHPLGRIGTPAEIASFVSYLVSEEASYITGAALTIDGGLSARFAT